MTHPNRTTVHAIDGHPVDEKLRAMARDVIAGVDIEAGLREALRAPLHDDFTCAATPDAAGSRAIVAYLAMLSPARHVRLRAHPVLRTSGLASISAQARIVADDMRFVLMTFRDSADLPDLPAALEAIFPLGRSPHAESLRTALEVAGVEMDAHAGLVALATELDRAEQDPRVGFRALVGIPDRLSYYAKTTHIVFVREMNRALELDGAGHDQFDMVLRALPDEHRAATVCWLRRHLDDLRGTDLTTADLAGVPLTGARWSTGTRWPSGWDRWVAEHSAPVQDAPGEFVVR